MSANRIVHKLFVYNLPWTVNSNKLRTYFSKFGKINSTNVIFNKSTGLSRGFGFVVFSDETGFKAATEAKKHVIDHSSVFLKPTA